MQRLMLSLDALVHRRRRWVLAAWLVALIAALPLAARQSDHLTGGGFGVPGSQSDRVEKALSRDFDRARAATLGAVLVPGPGARRGRPPRVARAPRRGGRRDGPRRARAGGPARGARPGGPRRGASRSSCRCASTSPRRSRRTWRPDCATASASGTPAGGPVATHLVGQGALWAGLQDVSKSDLAQAESTGLPIVALILLAVFGSLAAAALPLGLGAISVTITGALIYLLSRQFEMSVFVSNMASMIGIGVAVDYSLFVLARYREEVRAGASLEAARARAMATSGVAVAFSGMTVILSLGGPVADRRDRAALDGARRDPRRRGVGARGRDAAAGAAVADGAARRRAGPDRRRRLGHRRPR